MRLTALTTRHGYDRIVGTHYPQWDHEGALLMGPEDVFCADGTVLTGEWCFPPDAPPWSFNRIDDLEDCCETDPLC